MNHPDYRMAYVVEDAISAENAEAFCVFVPSLESRMEILENLISNVTPWNLEDMHNSWILRKIVRFIRMCPDLADKVENGLLLAACAYLGMREELKYLHENCPNLPITEETKWAFINSVGRYGKQSGRADMVEYMFCNMFAEPRHFIHALDHAIFYRSFTPTLSVLIETAMRNGVLERCDSHLIVGSAAKFLDDAIRNNSENSKRLAIKLLMGLKLSISEILDALKAEGFPESSPTVVLLNVQLKAAILSSSTNKPAWY